MCCLFFFKKKTAYEMRISDWSSDVCSSDLLGLEQLGDDGNRGIESGRALLDEFADGLGHPAHLECAEHDHDGGAGGIMTPRSQHERSSFPRRSEERRVGKSVSVRVDHGGGHIIKKKKKIRRWQKLNK